MAVGVFFILVHGGWCLESIWEIGCLELKAVGFGLLEPETASQQRLACCNSRGSFLGVVAAWRN